MKNRLHCYACRKPATGMEHIPPRAFFPRGEGLQLKTIPSCNEHNNQKSKDDQYVLAHICINASLGENQAKAIFKRSIASHLKRSRAFREILVAGSETSNDGKRRYKVDMSRFDNFFNHLAAGLFFDRYGKQLNHSTHRVGHEYLDFYDGVLNGKLKTGCIQSIVKKLFSEFKDKVVEYEADKIDEVVYAYRIMETYGPDSSITIYHTFYGVFNVITFLTRDHNFQVKN